jgi:GT2 family glycosyltransferase
LNEKKNILRRGISLFFRLIKIYIVPLFPFVQRTILPSSSRWRRRFFSRLQGKFTWIPNEYDHWLKQQSVGNSLTPLSEPMALQPLISLIMPVYNVRPQWLQAAVDSVRKQSYGNWELCIADDCSTDQNLRPLLHEIVRQDERIRVRFLEKNIGIAGASNAALAMAHGQFVGLLDNDDELADCALWEVVQVINRQPDVDLIYSDEDKITEKGKRYAPFFKPDFAPDTLRSYNYICHFTVIRQDVLKMVGGFRQGYDGSQDYDLFLRVTERTKRITHIPKILYHWRAVEGSVGKDGTAKMYAYESAKKALSDHLQHLGLQAEVENGLFRGSYHLKYRIENQPEVAIIIPSRDKVSLLKRCIDSIIKKTTYPRFSIWIVDNNSQEKKTFSYYGQLKDNDRVRVIRYEKEFNFSSLNNFAVQQILADYLLFLNNDTEVVTPEWLEELLGLGQRSEVGAVGCLLCYGNDTVQHGGVIVGIGGVAGHAHKHFFCGENGYFGRLKVVQNFSAVTAACMLVRKSVFDQVGGFTEELSHAFNDVDLCLKIREKGYLIVYTPFARLYHHESISRGFENSSDKRERFTRELRYMKERWHDELKKGDPYYNLNLSLIREDFSLNINTFTFHAEE